MKIPVNINITTERLTDGGSYGADGAETERNENDRFALRRYGRGQPQRAVEYPYDF